MIAMDLPSTQGAGASSGPASAPTAAPKIRFQQGNHSDFYRAVKAQVNDYFAETGRTRFADFRVAVKAIGCFAVAAGAYGLILSDAFSVWVMLVLAIVCGIASWLFALNVAHDAAHDAVFADRRLNRLTQHLCFCLLGADPYLWRLRHVKSHHVFPNVDGCDISADSNVFLRLSPNHPRHWYQRIQHFYAPIIYCLNDIHTVFVQDFQCLFTRRLTHLIEIRRAVGDYVGFVGCKLFYISIVFLVPLLVLDLPWWQVLIGATVMSFAGSSLAVYLLIGTHIAEETAFSEVAADGSIGDDWAVHAMRTSLDWSPYSRIAQFLSGGANAHAAHHLFPNVCHIHYIEISRIIARVARDYGISHNVTTLPNMIRSHFRFLRALGSSDEGSPTPCPTFVPSASAHASDGRTQSELDLKDEKGQQVQMDLAEELAWRREAAEQGDANAQYYLGRKYEIGLGLPQDSANATKWYVRAAEQGNTRAQNGLAKMFAEGRCVPPDHPTAASWYRALRNKKDYSRKGPFYD